jgi:hypothetical protein
MFRGVLDILHTHLGDYFLKVDSSMLITLPYMRIFSLENIPLQNRVFIFSSESITLNDTSGVTHAWKPRFYHQQLHVFLSLPHM